MSKNHATPFDTHEERPQSPAESALTEKSSLRHPLFSLVLLPIATTLTGVFVALLLNDMRERDNERRRVVQLIDVAVIECADLSARIERLVIDGDTDPPFLPVPSLANAALHADVALVSAQTAGRFMTLYQHFTESNELYRRYGGVASEYMANARLLGPREGPPGVLPYSVGGNPPLPEGASAPPFPSQPPPHFVQQRTRLLAGLNRELGEYRDKIAQYCDAAEKLQQSLKSG